MPIFDVTVVMHFRAEGVSYDAARKSVVSRVLSRLGEESADTDETAETENAVRRAKRSEKKLPTKAQEDAQKRYNDRIRRVACPLCKAKLGENCRSTRSMHTSDKLRYMSTTHGERAIAHRELYPSLLGLSIEERNEQLKNENRPEKNQL